MIKCLGFDEFPSPMELHRVLRNGEVAREDEEKEI
jgi:hypothetical protein